MEALVSQEKGLERRISCAGNNLYASRRAARFAKTLLCLHIAENSRPSWHMRGFTRY
jgi:hypothetical protein